MRGQRDGIADAPGDSTRLPLTPALSPVASDGGEGASAGSVLRQGAPSSRQDEAPSLQTSALSPQPCLSLSAFDWLTGEVGVSESAARQLVEYLGCAKAAFGMLPTQQTLAMERFFDESGGMQLVIHAPLGSRLNRAWGLALRKRFCRSFNFELQAAATEDTIILSLTTAHSFELGDVARYLHSNTVRPLLVQALCAAPMFTARWRWAATVALALPRFRGGKKMPPQIQRIIAGVDALHKQGQMSSQDKGWNVVKSLYHSLGIPYQGYLGGEVILVPFDVEMIARLPKTVYAFNPIFFVCESFDQMDTLLDSYLAPIAQRSA